MTSRGSCAWVAGSGRSGTTWLGTLLASVVRARAIFEPLHPQRADPPRGLRPAPGERPFLLPEDPAPEWARYVSDLFTGAHTNRWTRFGHTRPTRWPRLYLWSLRPRYHLVKAIRSNLLVPWLLEQARVPVVLVVRHPCAVVASQREQGWGHDLEPILQDSALVERFLGEHSGWLRNDLRDPVEELAARWSIETLVPLRFTGHTALTVVTYEDLVEDTVGEVNRILGRLSWPLDDRGLRYLEKSSQRPVAGSSPAAGKGRLSRWRELLTPDEVDRVLAVCHHLGLTVYDRGLRPAAALHQR